MKKNIYFPFNRENEIYKKHSYIIFGIFLLIGTGMLLWGIGANAKSDITAGVGFILFSSISFLMDYNAYVVDQRIKDINKSHIVKEVEKFALLKNDGIKIHKSYFETTLRSIINIFLGIGIIELVWVLIEYLSKNEVEALIQVMFWCSIPGMVLVICLFVLHLLNIFFFGKILCVISDEGIQLEKKIYRWDELEEVSFVHRMVNLRRTDYYRKNYDVNYIRIILKDSQIVIKDFPHYGVIAMKKMRRDLCIKHERKNLINTIFIILYLIYVIIFVFLIWYDIIGDVRIW